MSIPERRVKGLPSRGSRKGPLTDAQIRANALRIKRWRLVDRAVQFTHEDPACGFESIFSAEPMTRAQMRDSGVGPYAKKKYATTQTGGDGENRAFETQTELGEKREARAQCPDDWSARREDLEAESDLSLRSVPAKSTSAIRRESAAEKAARWARATGDLQHSREKRLAGFVNRAGAVADALLRDREPETFASDVPNVPDLMRTRVATGSSSGSNAMRRALKPHAVQGQPGSLTSAYVALDDSELTRDRRVAAAAFERCENTKKGSRFLLVAYAPRSPSARGIAGRGMLLVWDLGAGDKKIKHAMTLEGVPSCAAWGPSGAAVLCGTEEGALCAWDLREPLPGAGDSFSAATPEDAASTSALARHGTSFRRPSYSTEGLFFAGSGEDAFVDRRGAMAGIGATTDGSAEIEIAREEEPRTARDSFQGRPSRRHETHSNDFHVIALDSDGNVDELSVSELPRRDAEDVAVSDPGLRFGSRVRITRVSSCLAYGAGKRNAVRANHLSVVHVNDGGASEIFVADDAGVHRGGRRGAARLPRAFFARDPPNGGTAAATRPSLATVSLDFNPAFFGHVFGVFLAAHEGGTVALYRTDTSLALRRWESFTAGAIVSVRWSLARPSLFYVLDDTRVVFAFDLLAADPEAPVHFEAFGKKEKIVCLELAKAGEPGWDKPGQHLMCLGYDDGRVDVHAIAEDFVNVTEEEVRATKEAMT